MMLLSLISHHDKMKPTYHTHSIDHNDEQKEEPRVEAVLINHGSTRSSLQPLKLKTSPSCWALLRHTKARL